MANLIAFPEDMTTFVPDGGATIVANAATAPDGTMTADIVHGNGTNTYYGIGKGAGSASPGEVVSLAVFVRAINVGFVAIEYNDGFGYISSYFNVATGSVDYTAATAGYTVDVVRQDDYGDGWYRYSVRLTVPAGKGGSLGVAIDPAISAGADGNRFSVSDQDLIAVWGVQLEIGAGGPSDYIADSGWSSADSGSVYTDTGLSGALAPSFEASALCHSEAAYADFDTIGTFRVSGWKKEDGAFVLQLEDKRKDLKRKIPTGFYDRTTYPNMEEDSVGEPIPIAYGIIYDIRPVCIDLPLLKFKVAGHAIKDFTGCRVFDGTTETWTDAAFATTDEANGEFTLSEADWDRQARVAVDFSGRVDISGNLMDNSADIVEDLLMTYLGVTAAEIDATTFLESWTRLYLGDDPDGVAVNARRPSLYLSKAEDATKILGRINGLAGAYLFPDASGVHRFKVFEPEPGNTVEVFDEAQGDLFSFVEDVTSEEIVSSVRAAYQYRKQQDYSQVVLFDRAQSQYLQGAASPVLLDEDVPCDRLNDATYWVQRAARMQGERQRIYRAQVSHRGWVLLPAQQVRIVYARHGINQVFEVLEVKRSLSNTLRVELIVGDLHGFGVEEGFLSADAPVFPASLGGGSASAWDGAWADDLKAWARQNVGYISDDNGFANATDSESFNTFVVV